MDFLQELFTSLKFICSASPELQPDQLLLHWPALPASDAPTSMLLTYNFRQSVIFTLMCLRLLCRPQVPEGKHEIHLPERQPDRKFCIFIPHMYIENRLQRKDAKCKPSLKGKIQHTIPKIVKSESTCLIERKAHIVCHMDHKCKTELSSIPKHYIPYFSSYQHSCYNTNFAKAS